MAWLDQTPDKERRGSFVNHNNQSVTIAVRGTTSIRDVIQDLKALKTRFEPHKDVDGAGYCCDWVMNKLMFSDNVPLVHLGFYQSFLSLAHLVRDELLPRVNQGTVNQINFVGHSLGGAVAALLFAYFLTLVPASRLITQQIHLTFFTIGQPRVGTNSFSKFMEKLSKPLKEAKILKTFRVICNKDLIPSIPLFTMGFRHFGKPALYYENDDQDLALLFGTETEHRDSEKQLTFLGSFISFFCCCGCIKEQTWEGTRFENWLSSPKNLILNHLPDSYYSRCKCMDERFTRVND